MRRSLLFLSALVLTVAASPCTAGIISFEVDSFPDMPFFPGNIPASFVQINIDGQGFQSTPVTGTATLDLPGHLTTPGTAQITSLDLTLTNGLSFTLPSLGGETASTAPGGLSFSLIAPGAPAIFTLGEGGGTFDQLGNQFAADGDLTFSNFPTFDLDTVTFPPTSNFPLTGIGGGLGSSGNEFLILGVFGVEQELEVDGTTISFSAVGQFVGIGTKAVPEPGSTMILIGMGTLLLTRRRR